MVTWLPRFSSATITFKMSEIKIVFMGTPQFGVMPLEYLVTSDFKVVGVYTQQDQAAGRGQLMAFSPVKKAALDLNLPVVQPRSLKTADTVTELAALEPDLIVVAAFGQILSRRVLDIPRFGCLNIHPSLLPKYRGVSPVPAAILAGDEFTGVSVMLLDPGTDTGPLLAQVRVPILPWDTTGSLTDKLSRIGAQLLLDVIPRWTEKQIKPQPQDESQASYSRKLTKEDGTIDWHLSAVDLERRIRAFSPWPGTSTTWHGRQLKILTARPIAATSTMPVGEIVAVADKDIGFGIVTGDGILGILSIQFEGKRAMSAADFARGQRGFIGAVLPA
jgi:methionyl-tRNA formyltransferase